MDRQLLTIKLEGTRYRGAYTLDREQLIVEAHGLGRRTVDAALVDYSLGEPAHLLATLVFTQLVKENVERGSEFVNLVAQGATTQINLIGAARAD